MDYGLKGTRAIVTAGTMGIGRGIVDLLLGQGAVVATCARNEARLKELEKAHPGKVITHTADFQKPSEVETFFKKVLASWGGVDLLFYNAPHSERKSVSELDLSEWDKGYDSLMKGLFVACEAVIPVMKEKKKGSVVVLSSITAVEPIEPLALSSVFRSGLKAWVSLMAKEYGPYGIRVNAVLPGFTRSDRLEGLARSQAKEKGVAVDDIYREMGRSAALKRIAEPEEIAHAALFLSSPAASYITGISMVVDGGLVKAL